MANRAPIMRLKEECFNKIFDYLTLRELSIISETCPKWKELAGKYYGEYFKSKEVCIGIFNENILQKIDSFGTIFGSYANDVQIFDEEVSVFEYVAENINKNLKSIQFVLLVTTHAEYIKEILANVENVKLIFCLVDGNTYDNVLKYCPNLKCLNVADSHDSRAQWPRKRYPKLECLTVIDNSDGPFDGLNQFLKLNPQIKRFSTSITRPQLFPLIEQTGLKLDEFSFEIHGFDKSSAKATRDRLNGFYKNGHYKQLKVSYFKGNNLVDFIDIVQGIEGLTGVEIVHCIYNGNLHNEMNHVAKALAKLKNLQELGFQQCEISLAQADILSRALVNLQQLNLERNSIDMAIPFARRLSKLKIIKVGVESTPTEVNIESLQKDRKKLLNAQKLTIFVPEEVYIQIKWTAKNVKYDLVEIKQDASFEPHC